LTIKEQLRDAGNILRRKMRTAKRFNEKAYKKASGVKGGTVSGNTRKRGKRAKAAAETINASVEETGRDAGTVGA
jgi:hypothetical protein